MALYGMSVITGILISGIYCCVIPDDFVGARAHGDIIIGGLFAVHGRMMNSVRGYPHQPAIQNCAGFEMQGFLQILAMAHTIELINNSSLIPGVKLGYEIYDTCSESTQAISATLRFLSTYNTSGDTLVFKCNYSDYTPRVKAVIGDSYSEVSIAVATLLNTQLIPQVSHASSAEILSDKFRFPAFLRTIPNDSYQTRAMAKLINFSGWNWIGLITMDDDYGRSAIESFGAQAININVCIAFKEVIPSHLSDSTVQSRIDKTIQTILKETSLLQSLKAVNFTYKGRTLFFDSKGDASTGYDVLIWKKGPDGKINITPFAEYDTQKGVFRFSTKDKENEFTLLKEIRSRCSDECKPGQMKKTSASQHTCCYECVACPENHYTNNKDMVYCLQCNNKTHWSPVNSTVCYLKKIEYLRWDDGFAIVLLLISFIGIFIIVAIALLFTKNFDTPVVKASGGFLCYIILFSILLSFVSAVFFIGKPEDIKCKMRQTMFGISFTVAVACILLKSIKILLAFTFEPKVQSILKRLYKPFTLVFVCTGIQIIICTTWLVFWSPYTQENFSLPKTIILECDEGSTVAFGIMLGYIALLTFICFIFAFRGRKLPENYNEAKFITFGMLIYFIAWITFIPIYATTFGIYLPAVEMIVILISNYGILSCTFLPKCYIILCKQDTNTKSAFLKIIYKYSAKSASSLTVSHVSSSSLTLPEGSTTVPSVSSRPSVSCISNSFSFHERLVAADIPPTKARCLQRKRLSSI
ncbi:PREDICTED: G-protein coupled receptor family C group 6 member A-like isoform X3 [Nanorana parkeri]|uniref:G-protein coupled receptor family C group 6 member A-like isoform X3 n=1 Tax=Nanorana parkeri TaxID=125878 RepID=UPI000854FED5|nr:PREDICTED: G-protein coupled receptor family C group 6 member A-like isoform X3 [Nanorana parkeri]